MPARAIGSGTVSFGLVSIPVKIFTTNEPSSSISFNLVEAETGHRLKQQYINPAGEVVPRSAMAKGYEFAKGQYVVLSPDEVKALEAVGSNAIELAEFVPEDKVDPVFYDRHYYLGPDKGGDRAYALLSRAMRETGLVGLARYSARGKQYLVMVRPHGEGLAMHQLRYADEVKSFDEVGLGEAPEVAERELALAKQIIDQIAADEFRPEQYTDEVKKRVVELIDKKVEGEEITAAPEAPQGQIIDLMEALKASLGAKAAGKEAKAASGKRKPAKASATKKKTTTGRKKASSE
jgi:DNA end-binding protein Ku